MPGASTTCTATLVNGVGIGTSRNCPEGKTLRQRGERASASGGAGAGQCHGPSAVRHAGAPVSLILHLSWSASALHSCKPPSERRASFAQRLRHAGRAYYFVRCYSECSYFSCPVS